jgi:hypothetical protein
MADTNHALNGEAIDRALREALDVAPSPEFLARVRMRIANDPAPRSAWTTWMPAMVGATVIAAAGVIAVIAPWQGSPVRLKPDTTTDVRLKADTTTDVRLKPDTTTQVRLKPDTTTDMTTQVRLKPDTTGRGPIDEPEVLISAGESAAFRRLVAAARVGEDLSALLKRAPALEDASEIDIPLIKIEPLVPQTNGEGVPQ